jgi:hypothetical protein
MMDQLKASLSTMFERARAILKEKEAQLAGASFEMQVRRARR